MVTKACSLKTGFTAARICHRCSSKDRLTISGFLKSNPKLMRVGQTSNCLEKLIIWGTVYNHKMVDIWLINPWANGLTSEAIIYQKLGSKLPPKNGWKYSTCTFVTTE